MKHTRVHMNSMHITYTLFNSCTKRVSRLQSENDSNYFDKTTLCCKKIKQHFFHFFTQFNFTCHAGIYYFVPYKEHLKT